METKANMSTNAVSSYGIIVVVVISGACQTRVDVFVRCFSSLRSVERN